MADRIGNLLGHLEFSDDQLQRTQKGLKEAGVPMPNFSNISRELAKEMSEEPDEPEEPENSGWRDPDSFGKTYRLQAKGVVLDFIEQ